MLQRLFLSGAFHTKADADNREKDRGRISGEEHSPEAGGLSKSTFFGRRENQVLVKSAGAADPHRAYSEGQTFYGITEVHAQPHPSEESRHARQQAVSPWRMELRLLHFLTAALLRVLRGSALGDTRTPGTDVIKQFPLDERTVYEIPIGRDVPTTLMFPSAISAIEGANVTTSPDMPAPVLLHLQRRAVFPQRARPGSQGKGRSQCGFGGTGRSSCASRKGQRLTVR